jgi:hypothetical protein
VYPTNVAPSPDMVDMKALASVINPENEACRIPTRGTARRTALISIPYKFNVAVGGTGDYRALIAPFAFGMSTGPAKHIGYYPDDANRNYPDLAPLPGPITSGIISYRINSMSMRFDRTQALINT